MQNIAETENILAAKNILLSVIPFDFGGLYLAAKSLETLALLEKMSSASSESSAKH